MRQFKAFLLASAMGLGSVAPALSADLLPPPPPLDSGVIVVSDAEGWYIRGDAGVGVTQVQSIRSSFSFNVPDARYDSKSFSDAAFVRFGIGYQFNSWLRADITGEYRTASTFSAIQSFNQGAFFTPPTRDRSYDNYSGQVSHAVGLVNGYVDLGTWHNITPYLGVGIGYAQHFVTGLHDFGGVSAFAPGAFGISGLGYAPGKTSGSFAWALMAGLGYSVNKNLKLELGYRYLDLGTAKSGAVVCQTQPIATCPFEVQSYHLASHDFHIGMRWMFAGETSTTVAAGYTAGGIGGAGYSTSYAAPGAAYSGASGGATYAGAAYGGGATYAGGGYAAGGGAYSSGGSYNGGASYAGDASMVRHSPPPSRRAPPPRRRAPAPMSMSDAPPSNY
jgi:opacity protein-like surface antigen